MKITEHKLRQIIREELRSTTLIREVNERLVMVADAFAKQLGLDINKPNEEGVTMALLNVTNAYVNKNRDLSDEELVANVPKLTDAQKQKILSSRERTLQSRSQEDYGYRS